MITSMENRMLYAFYVLSENMDTSRRDAFLSHVKQISEACKSLGILYRPQIELKLSHYILIMDAVKSELNLTRQQYDEIACSLDKCLNLFVRLNMIDHNPFSEWLQSRELETLYNF